MDSSNLHVTFTLIRVDHVGFIDELAIALLLVL